MKPIIRNRRVKQTERATKAEYDKNQAKLKDKK